jgi:hypothetical protein
MLATFERSQRRSGTNTTYDNKSKGMRGGKILGKLYWIFVFTCTFNLPDYSDHQLDQ